MPILILSGRTLLSHRCSWKPQFLGIVGLLLRSEECLIVKTRQAVELGKHFATVGLGSPSFAIFCTVSTPSGYSTSGSSSHEILLRRLLVELDDNKLPEAWESFHVLKKSYGFPGPSLVNKLITGLSYSSDSVWLRRACDLVVSSWDKKSSCFKLDVLSKLALSLARAQMPVPASKVVRLLLEKKFMVPMGVLRLIIMHMVKTCPGTCLASNLLIQICSGGIDHKMSNERIIFNEVLSACVRFELSLKGEEIIEWMAKKSVIADVRSVVHIARLHEMNGLRDEIGNYKDCMDHLSAMLVSYSWPFYDSLLSLHFKFNDIDAAAFIAINLCKRCTDSLPGRDSQRPHIIPIGSRNLKRGLKLVVVPELLENDQGVTVESKEMLIVVQNRKLGLSDKALAKFLYEYKRIGQIDRFSRLLLGIQDQMDASYKSHLIPRVINACIHLGWLDSAHDLLDDFEASGFSVCSSAYYALLEAYLTSNNNREAKVLAKQMAKAGIISNVPEDLLSLLVGVDVQCSDLSSKVEGSDLACIVVKLIKEKESSISSDVYELNSSLYYFCKARMLSDAQKTYRKIQEISIQPQERTFAIMQNGYSQLHMYREITIVWGDIKRSMMQGSFVISRDLCESLVLNFIRGGYFERVMEVIALMKEHSLFADKWMFKHEFLSLHKNLYMNLKAWKARNDSQKQRLEYVQEFRKWAGIK